MNINYIDTGAMYRAVAYANDADGRENRRFTTGLCGQKCGGQDVDVSCGIYRTRTSRRCFVNGDGCDRQNTDAGNFRGGVGGCGRCRRCGLKLVDIQRQTGGKI